MISKIAIGCAQFGLDYGVSNRKGRTPAQDVRKIVSLCRRNGIDTYDTAPAYGKSESVLGYVLDIDAKIVTKTINIKEQIISPQSVHKLKQIFKLSLKRLNRTTVEGLLIHSAEDLLKPGSDMLYDWLQKEKARGRVCKIGVSIYHGEQIDKILDSFPIDIIQLPFNVLDQRLLQSGYLSKLKKQKVEIHARSAFLQGLLLMNLEEVPQYFQPYLASLKSFHIEAYERGLTPIQLALGFCMSVSPLDKVVLGVNNASQLEQIIHGCQTTLEEETLSHLAQDEVRLLNPALWKI